MQEFATEGGAALVIAHPGHELRVYGWLENARPRVYVLTDGSGRSGRSRLGSTEEVLRGAGATAGSVFGRLTDQALYQAILRHDHRLFIGLANELAEEFVRQRVEYVAGDAAEGYNPAHDVCRLLVNTAVGLAAQRRAAGVGNYDFLLVGRPDHCPERLRGEAKWFHLNDEALARKLAAAENYSELAAEVSKAIGENGASAFRVECLRPAGVEESGGEPAGGERPFYEIYGEQQVAAGHYENLIRYSEHMRPLAEALRLRVAAAASV